MISLSRTDASQTRSQSLSSPSQSPSSSSGPSVNLGHLGVVIGGVVGGAIGLTLLLLTIRLLRLRRLRNLSREHQPSPFREKFESAQSGTAFSPDEYAHGPGQLENGNVNDNHENSPRASSARRVSQFPSASPPQVLIPEDDALIQSISEARVAQDPTRTFQSTPSQPSGLVNNSTAHTNEERTQIARSETTERDMQLVGVLISLIRAFRGDEGESSGPGMAPPAYSTSE
jgi:hypothetical protein